eukprot:1066017-Pelagomonas_calceolata.AAC.5
MHPVHAFAVERLLAHVNGAVKLGPGKVVADLGAAYGGTARLFARRWGGTHQRLVLHLGLQELHATLPLIPSNSIPLLLHYVSAQKETFL